jgi:putative peptidoglycan lipid II flippase
MSEAAPELSSLAPQAVEKPRAAPSLLKAAGLIAAVTAFSKILGAVRDWAVMYAYGTTLTSDAYYAAFQLPAFSIVLLGGLGGPFHTATVAVFSRLLKDGETPTQRAKALASTFLTLTGIVFAALSVLVYFFAEPVMGLILSEKNPALVQEAAAQLKIMSPCIWVGGLVGILYGLSNIYNCFFWPSMSPVAMSLTIILGLLILPVDSSGMVLAWATVAGGVLQLLMQLPEFFKQKFSLKPAFEWKAPEIRQAGELLLPATIGTTIGQLVTYVDMFFASSLAQGAWAAVTLSNRLMQLPIGILQTALLVPIFPRFSRAAGEKNYDEIKRNFKVGVVSLWMISIPMLVLMMIFTEPLIRLIFQHGKFDEESTRMVSTALIFQAFQMIPYFARDSITRVFYAFHDSRTPLLVGLLAIGFKYLLNLWLVPTYNVAGITFAITIITFFNMFLLGLLSKRHIQDLGFKEMLLPFCKLAIAGLAMAGVILMVNHGFQQAQIQTLGFISPKFSEYGLIALASVLGCAVYTLLTLMLKVPEAEYLKERIAGRFLKRVAKKG